MEKRSLKMKALMLMSCCIALAGCATDKRAHFLAGAAVSGVVTDYTGSKVKGCLAGLGVGILKEVYDNKRHGQPDAMDALATGAGCTVWTIRW